MLITQTTIGGQVFPVIPPVRAKFHNFYRCPDDGTVWDDKWDCMCDDKCPTCGRELSPEDSDRLCPNCGASVEEATDNICPTCGTAMQPEDVDV
jgi:predicted RNA-binding Zn-ribbon protein involved in translation (DUF1610 family)